MFSNQARNGNVDDTTKVSPNSQRTGRDAVVEGLKGLGVSSPNPNGRKVPSNAGPGSLETARSPAQAVPMPNPMNQDMVAGKSSGVVDPSKCNWTEVHPESTLLAVVEDGNNIVLGCLNSAKKLFAMAQYLTDLFYSLTNYLFCFPGSPQLKINGRSFKLLRLLGEGGFSYVYLVQDTVTSTLYALKKIRCPFGQESVSLALKEVEAYALFSPHPNIIPCIDHCVTSAKDKSDPGSKIVYILLPYYRRGNLQDAVNANLVNHTRFPERRLILLFLGVARALKAMHQYRVKGAPGGAGAQSKAKAVRTEAAEQDRDAARKVKQKRRKTDGLEEDGDVEQEPLMDGE
ncbi:MAG: hypothetical protein Q9214_007240, partial [Letrouitia sp. 1 TL-2023]